MAEKVKVSCSNCGATNNYPLGLAGKKVVCGRCKYPLPEPGNVLELPADQASAFFQNARLPVLVDFFSPTCASCHMMHPIVDSFARRRAGEIMVVRINVDQLPQIAAEYSVQAVPTFVVLHKGYERGRASGALPEADFALWVTSKI